MENKKFFLIFVGAGLAFCFCLGLGLGLGHKANANAKTKTTTPALLITGGGTAGKASQRTVEVFVPGTNISCILPPLPTKIGGHTQDGLRQCGGYCSLKSCHQFTEGKWENSQNLSEERVKHNSWLTEDRSLLLLGGDKSKKTTEKITEANKEATTDSPFELEYETNQACSITDTGSLILTGGQIGGEPTVTVARYTENGKVEYLAELNTPRYDHACALYTTDKGLKVYLVMGGMDGEDKKLQSMEQLTEGKESWEEKGTALPHPLTSLRAVTVANIVYLTGGEDGSGEVRDEIYRLDVTTLDWVKEGKMSQARASHAVSLINYDLVEQFCREEIDIEGSGDCSNS